MGETIGGQMDYQSTWINQQQQLIVYAIDRAKTRVELFVCKDCFTKLLDLKSIYKNLIDNFPPIKFGGKKSTVMIQHNSKPKLTEKLNGYTLKPTKRYKKLIIKHINSNNSTLDRLIDVGSNTFVAALVK